jgi:hypothetical protein
MHKSLLFTLISLLFLFPASYCQELDRNLWATNGSVMAFARDSNTIYMAGNFDYVYPNTGGGAAIDITTGTLPGYDRLSHVNGRVYSCIPDGAGGWYIGGNFTRIGNIQRKGLAHILADNQVDPGWQFDAERLIVGSDTTHEVRALVIHNNVLFVGGRFSAIAGQPRKLVAAINLSTNTLSGWNPALDYTWTGSGYYPGVRSILVVNDRAYLGGIFSSVNGTAKANLAAVDVRSGQLLPWNPSPDGGVFSLLYHQNRIYAGGLFTKMSGLNRQSLAAIDAVTGEVISNWNPWVAPTPHISQIYGRPYVGSMAVSGNVLYLGGHLTTDHSWTGRFPNDILALNLNDGSTAWQKWVDGDIHSMALVNDQLYVGGAFSNIDNGIMNTGSAGNHLQRTNLAAIDIATRTVTDWKPFTLASVHTLATAGSQMYIGGEPGLGLGGYRRNKAAAFDAFGGRLKEWNVAATVKGHIGSIAVTANSVFLGGDFMAGTSVKNLMAVSKSDGSINPWNLSSDSTVNALLARGNTVFAGGLFQSVGSIARSNLAAVNSTTGKVTAWNPGANGRVYALVGTDNTLYAGGSFTSIAGKPTKSLAALDIATGHPRNFNTTIDGGVNALAIADNGVLYIGGYFYTVNGVARRALAALNAQTGALVNWQSEYFTSIYKGSALTISTHNNLVYVGGFMMEHLEPYGGIVALDAFTGKPVWRPKWDTTPYVFASLIYGGKLYVGGYFSWVGAAKQSAWQQLEYQPNVAAFGTIEKTTIPQHNYIRGTLFNDLNNNCVQEDGEKRCAM